jgi:hypothetical protein
MRRSNTAGSTRDREEPLAILAICTGGGVERRTGRTGCRASQQGRFWFRAVAAGEPWDLSLDAPPARWPDYFTSWRLRDVREIILHVITETAIHAGHLDAARELLDGRTWLGPDDTRIRRASQPAERQAEAREC